MTVFPAAPEVDGAARESAAARRKRLAWEAARIAEAEADIASGRVVDGAAVEAWLETIGTDRECPLPFGKS
jgi:predicted transcriptional regulator